MDAVGRRFSQFINGNHQLVIPIFQRDYSWTDKQCEQLWNDIIRTGETNDTADHFIGSVVYVGSGEAFNRMLVIDGQQRLTTLTILLTALRDHISETGWTGHGPDSPTVDKINAYFLKNVPESDERLYKLRLRRADNTTLWALVDGNPSPTDSSELIINAYEWFRSALADTNPEIVYRGVTQLNIVDVNLDRTTDNPQLVFESLNSTGVNLSQGDLIRNYLLMGLEEGEQTTLYERYWSEIERMFREAGRTPDFFLRDYVALKTQSPTQTRVGEIYDAFKDYWPNAALESSTELLLKDMQLFAKYYMILLGRANAPSIAIAEAIYHLRSFGIIHALLGMRLLDCYNRKVLTADHLSQALRLTESYMVRRGVLGLNANDYWSMFANIAKSIDEDNAFESLKVAFARQRYYFPLDDRFFRELQENNLYESRGLCNHILARLENDGQGEPSPVERYSIEHIMPQRVDTIPEWQKMLGRKWEEVHETWLHRLGNLTFTAYNSRMSNRPFADKKAINGGFNQSAVRLNQSVRDETTWTETQMRSRGEALANRALTIWPYHQADEKLLREADIAHLRREAARKTSASLNMNTSVRTLLDSLLEQVHEIGEVIEIIERDSVCCYGPVFFAELLPAKYYLRVILPLDFDEIIVPDSLNAYDTTTWKFVPKRAHTECDMLIDIYDEDEIAAVMAIVRKAYSQENE